MEQDLERSEEKLELSERFVHNLFTISHTPKPNKINKRNIINQNCLRFWKCAKKCYTCVIKRSTFIREILIEIPFISFWTAKSSSLKKNSVLSATTWNPSKSLKRRYVSFSLFQRSNFFYRFAYFPKTIFRIIYSKCTPKLCWFRVGVVWNESKQFDTN